MSQTVVLYCPKCGYKDINSKALIKSVCPRCRKGELTRGSSIVINKPVAEAAVTVAQILEVAPIDEATEPVADAGSLGIETSRSRKRRS